MEERMQEKEKNDKAKKQKIKKTVYAVDSTSHHL